MFKRIRSLKDKLNELEKELKAKNAKQKEEEGSSIKQGVLYGVAGTGFVRAVIFLKHLSEGDTDSAYVAGTLSLVYAGLAVPYKYV